jgi:hypothetical protein
MADHYEVHASLPDGGHATIVGSHPLDDERDFLAAAGYAITLDVIVPGGARYIARPDTTPAGTPPEATP